MTPNHYIWKLCYQRNIRTKDEVQLACTYGILTKEEETDILGATEE